MSLNTSITVVWQKNINLICQYYASSIKNEKGGSAYTCCHHGKVNYPENHDECQSELLYSDIEINKHFRQNIRVYNNWFAIASFNDQSNDIILLLFFGRWTSRMLLQVCNYCNKCPGLALHSSHPPRTTRKFKVPT